MKFQGSENYVATQDLMLAVNAAITLKRPLLVKGEPGTGKTMLAEEVATALKMPLLQWHVKSTTKAQQGLYEYDAVSRLRDSQLGDERVKDIQNYIIKGVLWQAFTATEPVALLIDEVDRADEEFEQFRIQQGTGAEADKSFARTVRGKHPASLAEPRPASRRPIPQRFHSSAGNGRAPCRRRRCCRDP